ncbi:MAG: hypothetical protein KAI83_12505 [Thiomargarita sp.]|nr:hypothetical protein [Thiomargarita sp.]
MSSEYSGLTESTDFLERAQDLMFKCGRFLLAKKCILLKFGGQIEM